MSAADGTNVDNGGDRAQPHGDLKVFVARLNANVTVDDLKNHFRRAGKVVSVNIPSNVVKESKRYGIAFVGFASKEGFEAALKLDQSQLDGQPIMVVPATKTHKHLLDRKVQATNFDETWKDCGVPVYEKSEFCVVLRNLPAEVSEQDVRDFLGFEIVDVGIFRRMSRTLRPKSVRAIVALKAEEDIEKAIAMSKKKLLNQEVVVEKREEKPRVEQKVSEDLVLFVRQIPKAVSEKQIRRFFSSAGALVDKVQMFKPSSAGDKRGLGYLTMKDKESLEKALMLNGKMFYRNKVAVSYKRIRGSKREVPTVKRNFCLYINNILTNATVQEVEKGLTEHFKKNGMGVKSIHVPTTPTITGNKGYAFVAFKDRLSLRMCKKMLNAQVFISGEENIINPTDQWPETQTSHGARDSQKVFGEPKQKKRKKAHNWSIETLYGPRGAGGPFGTGGPSGRGGLMSDGNFHEEPFRPGGPPLDSEIQSDSSMESVATEDYPGDLDCQDYGAERNAFAQQSDTDFHRFRDEEDFSSDGRARQLLSQRSVTDTGGFRMDGECGGQNPFREQNFRSRSGFGARFPPRREENPRGRGPGRGKRDDRRFDDRRDFDNPRSRRDFGESPDFPPGHTDREGFPFDGTPNPDFEAFGGGSSANGSPSERHWRDNNNYSSGGFPDSFASTGSNRFQTATEPTLPRSRLHDSTQDRFRRGSVNPRSHYDNRRGASRSYGQSSFSRGSNSDVRRQPDRDSDFSLGDYPERGASDYSGHKSGFGSGFRGGSTSRGFSGSSRGRGDPSRFSAFGSGGDDAHGNRRFGGSTFDERNLGANSRGAMPSKYYRKY